MTALLLCAGLGTRLRPLTDTMPKALVPLAGKPLLAHQLERLRQAGCTRVIVNVHHFADQVIDYLRAHDFGLDTLISDERPQLLDTGGAIRQAATLMPTNEDTLLVHNVDIFHDADLNALLQSHLPHHDATLLATPRPSTRQLLADPQQRLRAWTDTRTGEVKPNGTDTKHLTPHAFAGIHMVSRTAIEAMTEWPERFPIIDFYLQRCQHHVITLHTQPNATVIDVGKPNALRQAELAMSNGGKGICPWSMMGAIQG